MSKKFKPPLEALNIIKKNKGEAFCEAYKELLDSIEAGLNSFEWTSAICRRYGIKTQLELDKKLKALEIIKCKEVSVYVFKNWFKIKGNDFNYKTYLELQHDVIISLKLLSEDEFDLLKEILL